MKQEKECRRAYVTPMVNVRAHGFSSVITVSPYVDQNEGEWDVNNGGKNG